MVRRTKDEAQETRNRILDAAELAFSEQGVSRTSLEDIARVAGVTRGAIYWHFSGKEALLRAIREDVSLPLVDQGDVTLLNRDAADPIDRIERFLTDLLSAVEGNPKTRLAFSVMSFKCEYVGELESELDAYLSKNERLVNALTHAYADARAQGTLSAHLTPTLAAHETIMFVTGLLRLWLLDEAGTGARKLARDLIHAHVEGRRSLSEPKRRGA